MAHRYVFFPEFPKIPVLYVRRDSIYKNLPGFDPYDDLRDARTFDGNLPVIAHPPCATWARLRSFAKQDTHDLGIHALDMIHRNGGVLEHPAGSTLFDLCDRSRGFIISVNQAWFDHPAIKRTWLYICGAKLCDIPPFPLSFDTPTKRIESMSISMREHTPEKFAYWLRAVAISCQVSQAAIPPSEAMGHDSGAVLAPSPIS